jgi:acetoin utilization deacetylase AcuC-like enzyme
VERPARLEALLTSLEQQPIRGVSMHAARQATRAELERVHRPEYVEKIFGLEGRELQLDADTPISMHSAQAARLAAGAGILAVEDVVHGECGSAFAMVRPPGHHAEANRAMGFCLFNNVAVAAEHALQTLGLSSVLIVDWDVHHGNGTAHSFEARSDVLVFNTHQWSIFPGTGRAGETGTGAGAGFTINVPLDAGCGDAEYLAVFEERLVPAADAFEPELVLISAGYDAHERDPLGGMKLTDQGYGELTRVVRGIAERHAQGRLVAFLEGGYDLVGLTGGVRSTIEALL